MSYMCGNRYTLTHRAFVTPGRESTVSPHTSARASESRCGLLKPPPAFFLGLMLPLESYSSTALARFFGFALAFGRTGPCLVVRPGAGLSSMDSCRANSASVKVPSTFGFFGPGETSRLILEELASGADDCSGCSSLDSPSSSCTKSTHHGVSDRGSLHKFRSGVGLTSALKTSMMSESTSALLALISRPG